MSATYPRSESKKFRKGQRIRTETNEQKLERISRAIKPIREGDITYFAQGYHCKTEQSAKSLANALNDYWAKKEIFDRINKKIEGPSSYYIAVPCPSGWKVIEIIEPKKENHKGFDLEKKDIQSNNFGAYNKPLYTKFNGVMVMDMEEHERRYHERRFNEELAAGGDGGADGPDKGCKDIINRLGEKLYPMQDKKSDLGLELSPIIRKKGKESVFKGYGHSHFSHVDYEDKGKFHATVEPPKLKLGKDRKFQIHERFNEEDDNWETEFDIK